MGKVSFNQHVTYTYPRTNYNRMGAYNQMTPYMAQLQYMQGMYPMNPFQMQSTQTIEQKSSGWQDAGELLGTLYKQNPQGTTKFFKGAWNWCKNTAFPAIGKAATWVWNGITGLFSKGGGSADAS